MYSKLGANIKALRKTFGETQSDLLFAIGMEGSSPSTISQYETGDRIPERDALIKIARHYRITEDELINGNFSHLRNLSQKPANDKEINKKMFDRILPLISSDKALENSSFCQAYDLHLELYNNILQDLSYDENKIVKCLELYEKATEDGVIEACANILWWNMLMAFALSFITPEMYENLSVLRKEKLTIKDIVKLGYLPSFENEPTEQQIELTEARKEFAEESQVNIIVNIYKLKHNNEYSELGDYYLALSHKFGAISPSLSYEMNSAIGDELLWNFSLMQNPYAKKFFENPEE